ncbi:ArsR family transcriptional regulator [Nitratidesulfovibrio liaohensis]|uniref:ArsR family transcriptional regulator n=1 Tax=Nitratidesulfovibrio liaohensis TaxID=2604158 RepID=A0ABY9R5Q7_9BACT|nr:ArsR family transcriptional regulator [Nitratidesulfovibrio liaohensis]WMW66646.1 ArsR family transcriptional regulator [Nitratidesulfovibrio liaohensis]
MRFAEYVREDRLLVILRVLSKVPAGRANHIVLCAALRPLGHDVSLERMQRDLEWLAEKRLVTVEDLEATVTVATITPHGVDVAAGREVVRGVKEPVKGMD